MSDNEARKLIDQGDLFRDKFDFKSAVEAYDKALAIDPENIVAWISRGLALDELGLPSDALASFDRAIRIDPTAASAWSASAWYMRARELDAMGRFQEAVESYEKAEQLDPVFFNGLQPEKLEALSKLDDWFSARWPNHAYKELYGLVLPTETMLRLFIRHRLQQELGKEESEWWLKGVPENIRVDCAQMREKDCHRKDCFDYTYLIDLKEIINKQWKLFEPGFQRVKDKFKSKKEFLEGLIRLNEIRNLVAHPSLNVSLDEPLGFAQNMRQVIKNFTGGD